MATLEQTLMAHPALRRVVTLDGVVTTVDAGAWPARLSVARRPERLIDEQIALADTMLLTRAEHPPTRASTP